MLPTTNKAYTSNSIFKTQRVKQMKACKNDTTVSRNDIILSAEMSYWYFLSDINI